MIHYQHYKISDLMEGSQYSLHQKHLLKTKSKIYVRRSHDEMVRKLAQITPVKN